MLTTSIKNRKQKRNSKMEKVKSFTSQNINQSGEKILFAPCQLIVNDKSRFGLNSRPAFSIYIGCTCPNQPRLIVSNLKKLREARHMILSMYKNSFIPELEKSSCSVFPTTGDLNHIWSNQPKLNIVKEPYLYLKG